MTRKIILYCLIVLCLIGCKDLYLPTTPTRDLSQPTLSPPKKQYSTFTVEPKITEIQAPRPTITSSPAPTNTSKPTLTPLATKSSYHSLIDYVLITGDNDCRLPCWAGVTPGITIWDEAINILSSINNIVESRIYEDIENSPMENEKGISFYFSSVSQYETVRIDGGFGAQSDGEEMIISFTSALIDNNSHPVGNFPSVGLPLPERLSLKNVLLEYGFTDQVYLGTDLGVPEYPRVALSIHLVYPDDHFMVRYSRWANVSGDYLYACDPDESIVIRVIDHSEGLISKDAISNEPKLNLPNFHYLDSFQDVTDIPVNVYFEDYINSESDCLILPIDLWRYMLGE